MYDIEYMVYGIYSTWYRVFLWALVMGPFDSGGVCSTGPGIVYDM